MPIYTYQSTGQNPDKNSIMNKDTIDISVSLTDITASNATESIKLSTNKSEIEVYVDSEETVGSVYYTPLYTEKINYNVWKRIINKSFTELGAL